MKYNLDDGFSEVMKRSKKIRENRKKKRISIISAAAVLILFVSGLGYHILSYPESETNGPVYGSLLLPQLTGCARQDKPPDGTSGETVPETGKEAREAAILTSDNIISCDIESIADSVVRLEVYDGKDSRISTGTGFVYGDSKILVTSAHVIVNMEYMIVTKDDKTSFRIDSAAVLIDSEKDIAMYKMPDTEEISALKKADKVTSRGDPVITIGSQAGLVNLVTTGIVSGIWENDGFEYLIFTAPVSSGNSGGPLIDSSGNVIGVIIGTYDKAQNLNIALSIKELPNPDDT